MTKVVKFFKDHQTQYKELKCAQASVAGSVTLKLPGDTRWGSLKKCLAALYSSSTVLYNHVHSHDFVHAKTAKHRGQHCHS